MAANDLILASVVASVSGEADQTADGENNS
jgi:hypothetical protein